MAKISVYSEQTTEAVPSASIIVTDSWGTRLGGLAADKDGQGDIPDSYLSNKSNIIEVTSVGYEKLSIPVNKFNGNAFLKPSVKTGVEVIVRAKKKKPVKIVNPYDVAAAEVKPLAEKKKNSLFLIIGGGLLLGSLVYFLTKKK